MPGISGIETCQHIRKTSNVPILFLTARSSTLDKTEGLLAGGDDYMTKPFSEEELHARVIAQLRRYTIYQEKKEQEETFLIGGKLRVSEEFNEVWKEEQQIIPTHSHIYFEQKIFCCVCSSAVSGYDIPDLTA